MTYLYAGLGMAMVVAITAMFEIASSITQSQMASRPPNDLYFSADNAGFINADRDFLRLVRDDEFHKLRAITDVEELEEEWCSPPPETDCQKISCLATKGRFLALTENSVFAYQEQPVVDAESFGGSCVFTKGMHRVILRPNPLSATEPYRLFSCILDRKTDCTFENSGAHST